MKKRKFVSGLMTLVLAISGTAAFIDNDGSIVNAKLCGIDIRPTKDNQSLEILYPDETFECLLRGDVNQDGVLNVTDLSVVAAVAAGKRQFNRNEMKGYVSSRLADVNDDGLVDSKDAEAISSKIKGVKLF